MLIPPLIDVLRPSVNLGFVQSSAQTSNPFYPLFDPERDLPQPGVWFETLRLEGMDRISRLRLEAMARKAGFGTLWTYERVKGATGWRLSIQGEHVFDFVGRVAMDHDLNANVLVRNSGIDRFFSRSADASTFNLDLRRKAPTDGFRGGQTLRRGLTRLLRDHGAAKVIRDHGGRARVIAQTRPGLVSIVRQPDPTDFFLIFGLATEPRAAWRFQVIGASVWNAGRVSKIPGPFAPRPTENPNGSDLPSW